MKMKKKWLNKEQKNPIQVIQVNPPNSWPESWDKNNLIKRKSKQIIKFNSQSTQYWRIKFKIKKTKKTKLKSIYQIYILNYEIKIIS
jgi:hypothetical protein